ncbi:MAG: putative DNA binding domain-containing protein [Chitinophagaceae bacterium]|nr:putative DNA binding domain-containing protein [Chitinophagaceae bacterium]
MPEQQNIEYNQSWHVDYLKCGFANAQGGVIFIGKDDNGNVVGIDDSKKLMGDIPNKVRNAMGITVEVNLHEENGNQFIEIVTLPYTVPVSLRGRYYYRSGSTKQELTGNSLNEFLLRKSGKTWDDVIEPRATFDDIDENTFSAFLKMSEEKGRLPDVVGLTTQHIFEKLLLTEKGQLKRGALVLFGKNPERFYPTTFVKIGRWEGNNILFHDVEEGNLFTLLRNVTNKLNNDYLKQKIHFEGLYRIETGEYPREAMREVLLNALVHRNYMGAPIQIRVYDDKMNIWNDGGLPTGISLESLKRPHSSNPRNPIIAGVCFKGGLIDAWGSGTVKIIETCLQAGLPEPELIEQDGGFFVTLFKNNLTKEQLTNLGLNERQLKAVEYVKEKGKITNKEYQSLNTISERTASRELSDLVEKQVFNSSETKGAGSYFYLTGTITP